MRFKNLEKIGEGGFGEVFKAIDSLDDINYGIKRIRLEEGKY